jgi:hypothetical protein
VERVPHLGWCHGQRGGYEPEPPPMRLVTCPPICVDRGLSDCAAAMVGAAAPARPTVVSAIPAAAATWTAQVMPLRARRFCSAGRSGPARSHRLASADVIIVSPVCSWTVSAVSYFERGSRGTGRKGEASPAGEPSPWLGRLHSVPPGRS